ncbi:MAG TPA: hypothetical protein VGU73_12315 [Acidimicrobiia bacterium]|nr:hypothetical protein [Acidimicrobiia bacterium]
MLGIDATAALVGDACWRERAAFATLGGWVPTVGEPVAKLLVARHSRHHGWHAELLAEVRPMTRAHDGAADPVPVKDEWVGAMEEIRGEPGLPTVERLTGVYQVLLPRMLADYDRLLDATSPWSDGPVARRLRLVVDDERSALGEGLAVLEGLLARNADRAARRRATVEATLPSA